MEQSARGGCHFYVASNLETFKRIITVIFINDYMNYFLIKICTFFPYTGCILTNTIQYIIRVISISTLIHAVFYSYIIFSTNPSKSRQNKLAI